MTDADQRCIGSRLRTVRVRRGWTRASLAAASDVKATTLGSYEQHGYRRELAVVLARALQVDAKILIDATTTIPALGRLPRPVPLLPAVRTVVSPASADDQIRAAIQRDVLLHPERYERTAALLGPETADETATGATTAPDVTAALLEDSGPPAHELRAQT